jgi:hypothetical protein
MDLFTPVVPQEYQHPNFRHITKPGYYESASKVLNNWANGFVDRDGKFVKEFQTIGFNSSFWELYLFACFKELNCTFDQSHPSPDFVLTSPYGEFTAEATTANNPDKYRPEWDKAILEEPEMDYILRLSTLRLLQAVTTKAKKFKDSYSKLSHVQNKPFVICVSPFEQPFFFRQGSLGIVSVLYSYNQILTVPGPQEGELFIVGESRKYEVQKKPGTELPLGLFTNEYYREEMADVSAIIFSCEATTSKVRALATEGKDSLKFFGFRASRSEIQNEIKGFVMEGVDYQETLLDGCHVLFNPFAKHPLNPKIFEGREIAIHNYEPQTDRYQVIIPNGFLYGRRCMSVTLFETEEALNEYQSSMISTKTYDDLPLEIWPEDELMYRVGKLELLSENYMGHYRGWTILVSLHSIDKDWSALAVNTLCYSCAKFIEVKRDGNIASIMLGEWLLTKDEVYTAIKCKIDEISEQT